MSIFVESVLIQSCRSELGPQRVVDDCRLGIPIQRTSFSVSFSVYFLPSPLLSYIFFPRQTSIAIEDLLAAVSYEMLIVCFFTYAF
jgi:hypothetical protein